MATRLRFISAVALSAAALSGCGDEFDDLDLDALGAETSSLTTTNGLAFNGIGGNQLKLNGIAINQLKLNQLKLNQLKLNQLKLNQLKLNGRNPSQSQKSEIETLFRYMAECALQPGQSVPYTDRNNKTKRFYGSLGLAPYWDKKPLYPFPTSYKRGNFVTAHDWKKLKDKALGEKRVTACLAARSNALGIPVQISLTGARMFTSDIHFRPIVSRSSSEISSHPADEATFSGNLFRSPFDVFYRPKSFYDPSDGRMCAMGPEHCGFKRGSVVGAGIDVYLQLKGAVMKDQHC